MSTVLVVLVALLAASLTAYLVGFARAVVQTISRSTR
jgi:hypothetical protein